MDELNTYVSRPQGAAVPLARDQKLETAIFLIQEARVDYEGALAQREHGAVAADRFMRAVMSVLDDLNMRDDMECICPADAAHAWRVVHGQPDDGYPGQVPELT